MSLLDNVVVVLWQPQDINNVGGVLRAMHNFGLGRLRLVEPAAFDPRRLTALAHGADALIAATSRHASLSDALADCGYVLGTTRRPRSPQRPRLGPRAAAALLLQAAAQPGGPAAIIFGREDDGLPRTALDRCHAVATIATDTANPSLNLAQAALVFAYELWQAYTEQAADPGAAGSNAPATLATVAEEEAMFAALAQMVQALQPKINPSQLERAVGRMRAVLLRAAPRTAEAAMLTRLFTQAAGRLRRPQPR